MHAVRWVGPLVTAAILLLSSAPGAALDVTLDSGAGALIIVDNDINDLDINVGTVEFDVTVGGKLEARARVREANSILLRGLNIAAVLPDTHATFRNIDAAAATFTITVNSSPYATTGPPLGGAVFYTAEAADPTPDDVQISSHSVAVSGLSGPVSLATATGTPISPPVPPGSQPVLISTTALGSDNDASATQTRLVLTFAAGPGDELRIPNSEPLNGEGIDVWVYNKADRCVDQMNHRASKIVNRSAKVAYKCVKSLAKIGGSPASPCTVDLTDLKIDEAEDTLITRYEDLCDPLPPWGVNGGTCCDGGNSDGAVCSMSSPDCDPGGTCRDAVCISGAAERSIRDLGLDIFGGTALIGTDEVGGCQAQVMKRATRVVETRWKELRKCKKKNIATISGDAALIATCFGPPQPDLSSKIARGETKVVDAVSKYCIAGGVLPVGSAFPGGRCSDEVDAAFATCVNQRIACRFCLAANTADDIDPPADCDAFDDGVSNASCP